MFAKLLKHEMKATAGSIGLLSLAALGMGVIGGIMMRYIVNAAGDYRFDDMSAILAIFYVFIFFGIMAYALGSELFLGYQFYKRKFTDQGYLTFTLPAHSWQIFLSSMVNIMIWTLIIAVVTTLAIAAIILIGFAGVPEFRQAMAVFDLSDEFKYAFSDLTGWMIFYGIAQYISSTVTMMTAITLGSVLAKKHKIMGAIGVYYVWSLILGIISTQLLGGALITGIEENLTRVYTIETVLALAGAVGGFLLSCWLMDKKLNLP